MFGNNGVSSSWANPPQNQQQQQPNAFGQPSGFGSGAFGSGAFGQPQQPQQQPQANPMFGNLGSTPSTNTNPSAFGTFGSTNTASNTGSLFGQPKPATGFGAFGGGTSPFGSGTGGTFGATNNAGTTGSGGGLFSAQPPTTTGGPFGISLFGANKPAVGFGASTTTQTDAPAPVTTGTANSPYQAYSEKDSTNPSLTLQYQSITCMPPYRGSSFEELRWQDYQQGRKTAGAFGQTSFGAPAPPSTGPFGQPAAQNPPVTTNPMFGNFGSTNTANTSAAPGGGAFGTFGQPSTTTQGGTGGGLFSGFGQQQQQPPQTQPTAFGAFGQTQQPQQNTGTGLFSGTAFGNTQQQQKPAFGGFGGGGTFGSGGAFSQPQNQQQQGTTGGNLFGQQPQQGGNAFSAFGQTSNAPKPSIFGTPTTAPQTTGFSAFGTQPQNQQGQQGTQPSSSLFGGGGGGGGLFGQSTQQQQQQQPGQQQQQQPGGLFGTQPTQQPAGGSLFSGGGLFGNTNQQQQQQPQQQQQQQPGQQSSFSLSGGLKPPAPATQTMGSGMFGGGFSQPAGQNTTTGQQTSLFGPTLGQQPNQQQGTNAFGGSSLFDKPTAPPLGNTQSTGQQGGSLFGNTFGPSTNTPNASAAAQGAQGTLTASIAQPIGANLPIFSMLPPGPRAVTLEQQPKKKPGYFVDVPTRSPVPRLQLTYAPASTKLRGFGSTSGAMGASTSGGNLLFSNSKPNALSLSKAVNGRSVLGPESFLTGGGASPTLGSGGRKSVKKLILDKKVEPSDLFTKSGGVQGGKVTFSPALSVAAREKEAAAGTISAGSPTAIPLPESPTPAPQAARKLNRFTAQSTTDVFPSPPQDRRVAGAEKETTDTELHKGDYWMKPDLETLKKVGHEELVSLKGLTVGRKGYGHITFLEPVDLTNVPKLSGLLGELVRFDDKECSVYPDSDEAEKPPPGSGLNVAARIELVRCWAQDKATREPIKDEKHPHAVRHFKRLKHMKHTHFESFDIEEGKWIFTVDHF
ncbi:hypothetical protein AcV7_002815 [Taiwanofungus camphoratus]|nr:hypothetical protein AcV7_002815 [Antrodia cinnamomea]